MYHCGEFSRVCVLVCAFLSMQYIGSTKWRMQPTCLYTWRVYRRLWIRLRLLQKEPIVINVRVEATKIVTALCF